MQNEKIDYDQSQMVVVGRFVDTYGLNGWLKLKPYLDRKHWRRIKRVFLKKKRGGFVPFDVDGIKNHGKLLLVKLSGFENTERAQSLSSATVFLPKEELPKKKRDEYYFFELEGSEVYSEDGTKLGKITDIQELKPYALLEIDKGRLYIPFVKGLVLEVKDGRIVVSTSLKALL